MDNNNEVEELVEHRKIEDTPFTAVRVNEDWFLTMGKYRLTEKLKTVEECQEEAKDASWMRIMQIVQIMIEEDKLKPSKNQNN